MKSRSFFLLLIAAAIAAGCESSTDTGAVGRVSLTAKTAAGKAIRNVALGNTAVLGPDSVHLLRARVLLRHISFDRDSSRSEFRTNPLILDLEPGGVVHEIATGYLPEGEYDRIRFRVHRMEAEDMIGVPPELRPAFDDFLAGERYSVIAEGIVYAGGSPTGEPFTYRSRIDETQEHDLVPPVMVGAAATVTVTMVLDAGAWFISVDGGLLDPRSSANENAIDDNIKSSIDVVAGDDGAGMPE